MNLRDNLPGGYRFLSGIAPYSSGVIALPGYEIIHATLRQPVPYRQGFALIERHLAAAHRPRQALCAIALRSPRPFTFEGFAQFNQGYQQLLAEWGLLVDGRNPLARTNVAPALHPPSEPALYAFAYTGPTSEAGPATFVVAGAGELNDQAQLAPEGIVRPGQISPEAMAEKATCVIAAMQARLAGLGVSWNEVTTTDIYTVQPLHSYLNEVILTPLQATVERGLHWFYSRPPIIGLEFEMDLRGVRQEIWLEVV